MHISLGGNPFICVYCDLISFINLRVGICGMSFVTTAISGVGLKILRFINDSKVGVGFC